MPIVSVISRNSCGNFCHICTNEIVSYSWRGMRPDSPSVERLAKTSQMFQAM